MIAAILFASLTLDSQAHTAKQAVAQLVHSSLQRQYCDTHFELRDREAKRKKGLDTSPENDLAIERLRNRKAQLEQEIDKLDDKD
jgi:hypothetical protein